MSEDLEKGWGFDPAQKALLGDAAANAAVLAARAGSTVQDVDYPTLRGLLESQSQVLELPK